MLTQPLTRPLTRKIHRAQLTSIRYRDFDPLSLEPYLLFDAESSMLGNLENPTLDLDASDNGSLDVITATRAGIATYTAADGQIVTADENTVRVDWSLGYPAMLIEPSATNTITQTDFSTGWSLSASATIEQTTEPTPLPTQTALRIKSNGATGGRYQAPYTYSGTSTASVYIKWDGVDTRFRINRGISNSSSFFDVNEGEVTHYASSADAYSIEYHGDGWWRVSNTVTNPTWIQLYADDLNGTGSILVALPQHEAGTLATSFIPTSGSAVTRNADNLVIDGTAFSDFYSTTEGTFYVEFQTRDVNEAFYVLGSQSASARFLYSNGGTNQLNTYDGAGILSLLGLQDSTLSRVALSIKSNEFKASKDGSSEVVAAHNGNLLSLPTELRLGRSPYSGAPQSMNGYLKRLLYWPTHSSSL